MLALKYYIIKIIMMLTENVCSKYQLSLQLQHNIESDQWKSIFCFSPKYTVNRRVYEFQ